MENSVDSSIPVPGPLLGDRITVRAYTDEDAQGMFEAIHESVDNLRPWMPWTDSHQTLEDSLEYIRQCQSRFVLRTDFPLGMFDRANGTYLGGTGLHIRDVAVPAFEIGYWIRTSVQGHGYVSEALRLLTACAFDTLGAQRVMVRCDARNERSRRVAERQGYVFEGRHRNGQRDPVGDLVDLLIFALIPSDFARVRPLWREAPA